MRVLVVDNYDSFVFNLVQYLGQLGVDAQVWRNDDPRLGTEAETAKAVADHDGVLLSPGPAPRSGRARRSRSSGPARRRAPAAGRVPGPPGHRGGLRWHRRPGARAAARQDQHRVSHECRCAAGLPNPFTATRYHSLTILPETVPAELEVTARTGGGVIMAVRHVDLPIHGVQFHPESILTEGGHRMLANWLGYCGTAPDEALVHRLEQEVADTVRYATAEPATTRS